MSKVVVDTSCFQQPRGNEGKMENFSLGADTACGLYNLFCFFWFVLAWLG